MLSFGLGRYWQENDGGRLNGYVLDVHCRLMDREEEESQ